MLLTRKSIRLLALAGVAAAFAAGCREDLEGGAACPSLCPQQNVPVRDTTIEPIVLDTTVGVYPALGEEPFLLVASRGDTLQSRAILRFDVLPRRALPSTGDSVDISAVDSATVEVVIDSAGSRIPAGPVVVEVYDVDTAAAVDTSAAALAALFRPDRLIGSRTFATAAELLDTLGARVPIDNAVLLDRVVNQRPLRVGLLARAAESVQLRAFTIEGASATAEAPRLRFDALPGDTAGRLVALPRSSTPADRPEVAGVLGDYNLVLTAPPPGEAGALEVGGLPGRRAYLRFEVPRAILDSTTVVRATLTLTQRPERTLDGPDTVAIYPRIVEADVAVTDIARAADILGVRPGALQANGQRDPLAFDSLRVAPADSGERALEVVNLLIAWRFRPDTLAPRALVLQSAAEGAAPARISFFSNEVADPALRPRLRISYIPRVTFGLP